MSTPEEIFATLTASAESGTPGRCAWCEEDRPETWSGRTCHGQYLWQSGSIVGNVPENEQPELRLCAECWQEDSEGM